MVLSSLSTQALPCTAAGGDHSIASVRHPKPGEQLNVGPTAACGDGLIPLQLPRMAADPQAYANLHERPEQVRPVRGSSGGLVPDNHLVPARPLSASHTAVAMVQCISSCHSRLLSSSYDCLQKHQDLVLPGLVWVAFVCKGVCRQQLPPARLPSAASTVACLKNAAATRPV